MALEVAFQERVGSFELDVQFDAEGGTTAILGPSGAGKTLTLRTIAGLQRPAEGRIRLDGRTLFDAASGVDLPARQRRVGLVFQEYALFPHLSVAANLAFGLHGKPRASANETVSETVSLLGLQGLESRRPWELSGGQRQRVAVGRALASGPGLLLLDEPFSALDAPTREGLVGELEALLARLEVPAVLVTHDVAEAYALAGRLVVLDNGRVLQAGPREEVFHAPVSPQVARLVGVRNLLPGVVKDVGAGTAAVDLGGLTVRVDARPPTGREADVVVGVRQQDVEASPASESEANATLVREVDSGARRTLVLRLSGGAELLADLGRETARQLGAELPQRWRVRIADGTAIAWAGQRPAPTRQRQPRQRTHAAQRWPDDE